MDPIIRAAAVSPTARQLQRQPRPAPAAAPVPVAKPAPALAAQAAPAYGTRAPVPPAPHPPISPELEAARAALQERESQIAMLKLAARESETALATMQAEAEQRGLASGEEKGERAGRELLQAQAERVKALVFQIGKARQQVLADAEDDVVAIAFTALCRIIGEQGASRPVLQTLVREAIAASRAREQVVIRLHPDDAALMREGGSAADEEVRFCADATVALGGCLVESSNGTLDARFETQLGLLAAALSKVRAERALAQQDDL